MYDLNFDSQRLAYHPERVAEWQAKGRTRGPLYTEMELIARCNQRCIFCSGDYSHQEGKKEIDTSEAKKIISDLHSIGNKSIMFAGFGEPLLHKEAAEIIQFASRTMSVSVTTNGTILDTNQVAIIDGLAWIRFSINGCDNPQYNLIHGTKGNIFHEVLQNIERAAQRKRHRGLQVTIGTQLVLLEENASGIVELVKLLKGIGVDYFSLKPYSQHPLSKKRLQVPKELFFDIQKKITSLGDATFKVISRADTASEIGGDKEYGKCFGTHFICYISADADVWECNVFYGDKEFRIGNASRENISELWNGDRRTHVLKFIENKMKLSHCRDTCRMHACNKYLWRLKKPLGHDNFI